ncbi:hypothetical protein [Blastopirellula marina]|uniref:Uncharacterized protein n=1 Tax=Blastopirellula marina TaxID=124 RepID=A0A2S8F6I7_9BACT|nr:hypothetical protein [Blastopirellula marina]PQO27777.1 hypothetical protein C5Y98_27175 [Blastopirellula marina]PTL41517.1 hypothetical protein C5Y97_27190 [Blastopirellula marina]
MFYWPAWSVGTALIVASWFDLVSVSLGWTGFAIAGLVTIASNILSASPQGESSQLVLLDSRMIHAKGDGYETGMRRFQNGSQLLFDGVIFQQMRHDELVCMVFAHATELDDDGATELASHAISAFDLLVAQCPEFADACRDRVFRISIMSSNDPNAVEMCRVVDGKLEWKC